MHSKAHSQKHQPRQQQSQQQQVPYPNVITQVNKEDDKKSVLDFLNFYKCCSLFWRCIPSKKQNFSVANETSQTLLEPQLPHFKGKKTLVLDLDETLVHSTFEPVENPDLVLPVRIQGMTYRINVMKRPGCEEFLARMGELFEVVVFTASLAEYAEPLVRILDPTNSVSYLLFRQHCTPLNGIYVKDMTLLGRDIKNIILVDNSPNSFLFQPENAYHIKNFFDDKSDRELIRLANFLENIEHVEDVRPIEEYRRKLEPPSPQRPVKFAKGSKEQADVELSAIQVNDPSAKTAKRKEERERTYNIETEPDLRRDDREGEFGNPERGGERVRQYGGFYNKGAITERVVVNDRFSIQPLDSSVEIELPSPKESDALINHREADTFFENNSNSTDSKEGGKGNSKTKFKVPPLSEAGVAVFARLSKGGLVAVEDSTLEGHVDDVRYLTGRENLNSPLGKHLKIELDNKMVNS